MVTIGSVGDIIALTLLVKDLVKTVNSSTGAAAEYQGVFNELELFSKALLEASNFAKANQGSPEVQALSDTCARIADKSKILVDTFARRIRSYGDLAAGGGAGTGKRVVKSVQWHFFKDNVDKFRAEIHSHCDALQTCLATTQMSLTKATEKNLSVQITTADSNAAAFRNTQIAFHIEVRKKFEENKKLIEGEASIWTARWEWVKQLGSDIRSFMSNSMQYTCKIYSEIVTIRKAVLAAPQWSLPGDPFIFEDAFGRRFTFHLNSLHSWDVLEHAIEAHFRGRSGHSKVKRLEYSLFESKLSRPVDRDLDLDMAIMPGQHIAMSLVFHREEDAKGERQAGNAKCPYCGTVSVADSMVNVECATCLRWFSRIVEWPSEPTQAGQLIAYAGPRRPRFGKPAFAELLIQPRMTVRWQAEEIDEDLDDDPDIEEFQRVEIRVRLRPRQAVSLATDGLRTNMISAEGSTIADGLELTTTERASFLVESSPVPEAASTPMRLATDDASSVDSDAQSDVEPNVSIATAPAAATASTEQTATHAVDETVSDDSWDSWATFGSKKAKAKTSAASKGKAQGVASEATELAGYPTPPSYYPSYRYPESPPAKAAEYTYYSPRQYVYTTSPTKGHSRRATGEHSYHFSSYDTSRHYVYSEEGHSRRATGDRGYTDTYKSRYVSSRPSYTYVNDEASDGRYEYKPTGIYGPRPSPYKRYQQYEPTPVYSSEYNPPRSTRVSSVVHTTTPNSKRAKSRKQALPNPAKATEDDARKAGIPAGYSYKNWDPTEEPILLLGSVFDANSLGKYIYDWTVFFNGPATPMTEVAGELWLLLIQLAGKVKRGEECVSRIRNTSSRDLVEDFLDSGERLWQRFNKLLRLCENYMWEAAKKETSGSDKVKMGKYSGVEFVDSIFGRDRELERTEKLMTGMRLWSMRFDANCDTILANPEREDMPAKIRADDNTDNKDVACVGSADKDEHQQAQLEPEKPNSGDKPRGPSETSFTDDMGEGEGEEPAANVPLPSTRSPSPEPDNAESPSDDVQHDSHNVDHPLPVINADTETSPESPETTVAALPQAMPIRSADGGQSAETHIVLHSQEPTLSDGDLGLVASTTA